MRTTITSCLRCERYIPVPRYRVEMILPHKGRDMRLEGHLCEACAPKAIKHATRHYGLRKFAPHAAQ